MSEVRKASFDIKIKHVATDLSAAFIASVMENCPEAVHVFDHFHVVKLMNEKLDDIRRKVKKRNRPKSELMLSGGIVNLSKTIILGQEIGSVPIDDISLGFFFRMDIEFIEDHHLLVL